MRSALAFLTPLGGARAPSQRALGWFPVVGAAIGALLGLTWWGSEKVWPAAVAAAIVVAADLALTGMLHLDGLLDSADGLLPHLDRGRRLEVMRDHSVGAFGMAAGGSVLLLRWSALYVTRPSVLLLVGIWAVSRAAMAVAAVVMPYAREGSGGGIATAFLAGRPAAGAAATAGIIGVAGGLACLVAWRPGPGAVVLGVEVIVALGVLWFAARRIGGFTGDVLGAMGIIAETAALVVAAARW
jgi:cobalamin 5'-phosphate synthase/cobalamin synthase